MGNLSEMKRTAAIYIVLAIVGLVNADIIPSCKPLVKILGRGHQALSAITKATEKYSVYKTLMQFHTQLEWFPESCRDILDEDVQNQAIWEAVSACSQSIERLTEAAKTAYYKSVDYTDNKLDWAMYARTLAPVDSQFRKTIALFAQVLLKVFKASQNEACQLSLQSLAKVAAATSAQNQLESLLTISAEAIGACEHQE
eukprot:TRINITY_DN5550_c0_g2_i1.p1 TRINITY_DN5550_c0_g2~~TRINITY_DN5550_c0_g2_i1.p1  ORF type:complete len:212 (+),score=52.57 TRINITY_DN5550_c0_g2_i1:40-636(+)